MPPNRPVHDVSRSETLSAVPTGKTPPPDPDAADFSPQGDDFMARLRAFTEVPARLAGDVGSRTQRRVREIEDELSRFLSDPVNKVPVQARNIVMSRLFELAAFCGDLRAEAAMERGAAVALRGQLIKTRQEMATLQAVEVLLSVSCVRATSTWGAPMVQIDEEQCKVRVAFRERSGTNAFIGEVDPDSFKALMSRTRISLGWAVLQVFEDLHVPTCTFCAIYGHGCSSCLHKTENRWRHAWKCGSNHQAVGCTVRMRDGAVCCAECRTAGRPAEGHPLGFPGCPLLIEMVARLRARTNDGPHQ
ncbi:hypothetical protein MRX96_020731 [Rhipicephalus microplus]